MRKSVHIDLKYEFNSSSCNVDRVVDKIEEIEEMKI